jgi:hypothetical protein
MLMRIQIRNRTHNRKTLWKRDQLITRPLPTYSTTETEEKHSDIRDLKGIRTHDPCILAHALEREVNLVGKISR